jgi:hypothetical protein
MNITLFFTPLYYIYTVFIAVNDNSTDILYLRGTNSTFSLTETDDYNLFENSD